MKKLKILTFNIGIRVHRETIETAALSRNGRYMSDALANTLACRRDSLPAAKGEGVLSRHAIDVIGELLKPLETDYGCGVGQPRLVWFPGTKPDLHHRDTLIGSEKMEWRRERVSRIGERSYTRGKMSYRSNATELSVSRLLNANTNGLRQATRWSPLDYIWILRRLHKFIARNFASNLNFVNMNTSRI